MNLEERYIHRFNKTSLKSSSIDVIKDEKPLKALSYDIDNFGAWMLPWKKSNRWGTPFRINHRFVLWQQAKPVAVNPSRARGLPFRVNRLGGNENRNDGPTADHAAGADPEGGRGATGRRDRETGTTDRGRSGGHPQPAHAGDETAPEGHAGLESQCGLSFFVFCSWTVTIAVCFLSGGGCPN